MWCTRWLLPLFFFPVPTASPYILTLFLVSSIFHAKPCIHCIVVLVALWATSYHWEPRTINDFSPQILQNYNLTNNNITDRIHMEPRTWGDYSNNFFVRANVTKWEEESLENYINSIKQENEPDEQLVEAELNSTTTLEDATDSSNLKTRLAAIRQLFKAFPVKKWKLPFDTSRTTTPVTVQDSKQTQDTPNWFSRWFETTPPPSPPPKLPLFRRKYDLRPYGVALILDFGWSRDEEFTKG